MEVAQPGGISLVVGHHLVETIWVDNGCPQAGFTSIRQRAFDLFLIY